MWIYCNCWWSLFPRLFSRFLLLLLFCKIRRRFGNLFARNCVDFTNYQTILEIFSIFEKKELITGDVSLPFPFPAQNTFQQFATNDARSLFTNAVNVWSWRNSRREVITMLAASSIFVFFYLSVGLLWNLIGFSLIATFFFS